VSAPAADSSELAGGRPPVEYRFLGLDRRTFALPLIVVAVAVLWAVVSPAVDDAVDYDDPVRAGDAFVLGPSATIAPPVGWEVTKGVRTRDQVRAPNPAAARIDVAGDGVSVTTQAGEFDGDARALVKQVADNDDRFAADSAFTVEGAPRTFSVDGRRGVAQEFKTLTGEGAIFGFVEDGVGISIEVSGTADVLDKASRKLGQMLASIDFEAQGLD
jgi:hypothetical protein